MDPSRKRKFRLVLALSVVMLGLYVPLGYYVDRFFWRRRRASSGR